MKKRQQTIVSTMSPPDEGIDSEVVAAPSRPAAVDAALAVIRDQKQQQQQQQQQEQEHQQQEQEQEQEDHHHHYPQKNHQHQQHQQEYRKHVDVSRGSDKSKNTEKDSKAASKSDEYKRRVELELEPEEYNPKEYNPKEYTPIKPIEMKVMSSNASSSSKSNNHQVTLLQQYLKEALEENDGLLQDVNRLITVYEAMEHRYLQLQDEHSTAVAELEQHKKAAKILKKSRKHIFLNEETAADLETELEMWQFTALKEHKTKKEFKLRCKRLEDILTSSLMCEACHDRVVAEQEAEEDASESCVTVPLNGQSRPRQTTNVHSANTHTNTHNHSCTHSPKRTMGSTPTSLPSMSTMAKEEPHKRHSLEAERRVYKDVLERTRYGTRQEWSTRRRDMMALLNCEGVGFNPMNDVAFVNHVNDLNNLKDMGDHSAHLSNHSHPHLRTEPRHSTQTQPNPQLTTPKRSPLAEFVHQTGQAARSIEGVANRSIISQGNRSNLSFSSRSLLSHGSRSITRTTLAEKLSKDERKKKKKEMLLDEDELGSAVKTTLSSKSHRKPKSHKPESSSGSVSREDSIVRRRLKAHRKSKRSDFIMEEVDEEAEAKSVTNTATKSTAPLEYPVTEPKSLQVAPPLTSLQRANNKAKEQQKADSVVAAAAAPCVATSTASAAAATSTASTSTSAIKKNDPSTSTSLSTAVYKSTINRPIEPKDYMANASTVQPPPRQPETKQVSTLKQQHAIALKMQQQQFENKWLSPTSVMNSKWNKRVAKPNPSPYVSTPPKPPPTPNPYLSTSRYVMDRSTASSAVTIPDLPRR